MDWLADSTGKSIPAVIHGTKGRFSLAAAFKFDAAEMIPEEPRCPSFT
jgi:hypothetical protein